MESESGFTDEVSKKVQVYRVLKRRIVQNELKPQEYLNEQMLCDELGVSKTPVREALQHLERDRFVMIVPNKGCFVSSISLDMIREVFEIREIFECSAARFAAAMPSRECFKELLDTHESFRVADDEGFRNALLSGYQIHEIIVNSAGNSFLSQYYSAILDHILRIRWTFMTRFGSERLHETCEEHKRILKAIIDGDVFRAEREMRDHLQNSLISIDQVSLSNRKAV
ncbi:MAG TPA: GntR family transcriptional regulator [Magnetospirillaceae bacterium]|nr:GntR family transcriptional regulator [Magnetospirillaceae bacterium]